MSLKNKITRTSSSALNIHEPQSAWLRFFSSQKFIAFLALVFLILLAFPLAKSYSRRLVAEKEIEAMRLKIAEYEKNNQELKEFLDYLSSPQAAEDQARSSLNLKKPGEAVVIIQKEEISPVENSNQISTASSSALKLWWNYFFN
ncbi:septum formation initiator family protein [Patescibacteria group bacterium]|nr:septum formation initiator family protein [Patescibacteria group bacterium]